MKLKLFFLSLCLINNSLFACPELSNLDLAGEMVESKIDRISTSDLFITKDQFYQFKIFKDFDYSQCSKSLSHFEFRHISSGESYTAIKTNDDICDGGNSYGVLFNRRNEMIAEIRDSFIICL